MHLKAIDLDNFPTNATAQRMLSRVSPIYDRSYVMKWLYQVMGIELEEMKYYVKTFPLQRFPETASWGIGYLEQKYGIKPDESLELQQRRENAIAARPYRGAITPYRIEQVVSDLCGVKVKVEESDDYYFDVTTEDDSQMVDYAKVIKVVSKIKPSHIEFAFNVNGPAQSNIYIGGVVAQIKQSEKIGLDIGGEIKPITSSIYSGGTVVCIKQTECISMNMEAGNETTVGHIYAGGIVASEKQIEYLSVDTQMENIITIQAVYNMADFVVADTQNISIL